MPSMRRITADYVFTADTPPLQDGVVVLNDDGLVLAIEHKSDFDPAELEEYNGFLVPGFVNSHCHLELSHMQNVMPPGTGLIPFIKGVLGKRDSTKEEILNAIEKREQEMMEAGIVAVGDIANVSDTFAQKAKSNLAYYTFVELFDLLNPAEAQKSFDQGKQLYDELQEKGLKAAMAPHAPYSVSPELFKLVDAFNAETTGLTSIHNQETPEENEFMAKKEGAFNAFYDEMGIDISTFTPTGERAINTAIRYLEQTPNAIFVHNTMTEEEDIRQTRKGGPQIYWCSCPNANLYIENRLPDYQAFMNNNCTMILGTDSIASNWQLSILEEMKAIQHYHPELSTDQLVKWGTLNGAEALGFDESLGSISPGKTPAVNLIENVDVETIKLSETATVKRLI